MGEKTPKAKQNKIKQSSKKKKKTPVDPGNFASYLLTMSWTTQEASGSRLIHHLIAEKQGLQFEKNLLIYSLI